MPALNAPDYGSFVGQLKTNADGVYAGFAGSNPLRFLRAYREFGLKMPVFGNPTLVVRTSTQYSHYQRSEVARTMGLPLERVRVVPTTGGGAFGGVTDVDVGDGAGPSGGAGQVPAYRSA